MTFIEFFIIFIMLIIVSLYIKKYYGEIEYVKSNIDGRSYLVRKLDDKQEAADLIASINKDLQKLVNHLMAKYPDDIRVRRLYKNFNPERVSEGSSEKGYTSYSINKGEKIILCIRQKKDDKLVNKNVILYVAIHELAHLMTKEIGHVKPFWDNFKFILTEAIEEGIYTKVDYSKEPVKYCGIHITSSVV